MLLRGEPSLAVPGSRVRVPPLLFAEPPRRTAASGFPTSMRFMRSGSCWVALGLRLIVATSSCPAGGRGRVQVQGAPRGADSVLIAAAGDLVCGEETPPGIPCWHAVTAALVRQLRPAGLLALRRLQDAGGASPEL